MGARAVSRGADGFEMFHRRTWNDPAFLELSTDARLLFVWTWTAPANALCGLYHVSPRMLERALEERPGASDGELRARVRAALLELAAKPLVLYDDDAEVLWVVNRARYANRSPKVAVLLRREVEECPPSPLKEKFVIAHGDRLGLNRNGGPRGRD
jgi:hypothetical protein